jgi:hypothetical protein
VDDDVPQVRIADCEGPMVEPPQMPLCEDSSRARHHARHNAVHAYSAALGGVRHVVSAVQVWELKHTPALLAVLQGD